VGVGAGVDEVIRCFKGTGQRSKPAGGPAGDVQYFRLSPSLP